MQGKAECGIKEVDEMLQPAQPLMVALRYLSLLYKGRSQPANSLLTMKQQRKRCQADLEKDYYPYMLSTFQVQASRQHHVILCCTFNYVAVPFAAIHLLAARLAGAFVTCSLHWLHACTGSSRRPA